MKFTSWLKMRAGLLMHPQFYKNPCAAIWRRLLWKLYYSHKQLISFGTEYGFKIEGEPRDIGVGSLFYRGQYEWNEINFWLTQLNRSNLTILDVGANIGLYSLITAAHCHKKGFDGINIYSFEPNPLEFCKFEKNIKINSFSNIHPHRVAISDKTGNCKMAIPTPGLGVFGHLIRDNENISNCDDELIVETINLDSWCKKNKINRIDLIKLDVEGHELDVLNGSEELLQNNKIRILLMEVGHGQWKEAICKLQKYGYLINSIGSNGELLPFRELEAEAWCNIAAIQGVC